MAETGTKKGDVTHQDLTRAQQVIARRVAEAKATIPDFSVATEVDMEAAAALRAAADPAPSFNDLIVKAAAVALTTSPRVNAAYRDGRYELYSRVNVGIGVAAEDALMFPTIFDADQKDLATIGSEIRALAERVRDGVITNPELSAGTFTVANLGMYGATDFSAVINGQQAAILAAGAIRRLPRVVGDAVVPRHVLPLTLVCDHRILYGADAASFLARVKALLEAPEGL